MQKMHEVNQFLRVRSANEHNLKNVDINIKKQINCNDWRFRVRKELISF